MDLSSISTEKLLIEIGKRTTGTPLTVGNLVLYLDMRNGDPCLISKNLSGYEQVEVRFFKPLHRRSDSKPRAVFMSEHLTQFQWIDIK